MSSCPRPRCIRRWEKYSHPCRIERENAELDKLGMRVQLINKDDFSNPEDVKTVNDLRSEAGGGETQCGVYLRVMEVQSEGLVRKRNNEIGKTRWGPSTRLLPGDVICKVNDIVDVRKISCTVLTDLTMDFVIYRPDHRLQHRLFWGEEQHWCEQ